MGRLELIVETEKLCIYSPKFDGESLSEFEKFLIKHENLSHRQLQKDFGAIVSVIHKMLEECGARENLFRPEGGNIKAIPLFIDQRRKRKIGTLRLYCIRLSEEILIIGNGGVKTVAKYEEDKSLNDVVKILRNIEHKIFKATHKSGSSYDDISMVRQIIEGIVI